MTEAEKELANRGFVPDTNFSSCAQVIRPDESDDVGHGGLFLLEWEELQLQKWQTVRTQWTEKQRKTERPRGGTDLEVKLDMKESGLLDLKALRNVHMFPTIGHPKSPGGSQNFFSPSFLSYKKQFTLCRAQYRAPMNPPRTEKIRAILVNSIEMESRPFLSLILSSFHFFLGG